MLNMLDLIFRFMQFKCSSLLTGAVCWSSSCLTSSHWIFWNADQNVENRFFCWSFLHRFYISHWFQSDLLQIWINEGLVLFCQWQETSSTWFLLSGRSADGRIFWSRSSLNCHCFFEKLDPALHFYNCYLSFFLPNYTAFLCIIVNSFLVLYMSLWMRCFENNLVALYLLYYSE